MDMKTTVSGMGTPELSLLVAATAQTFRFYGLPSSGTAVGTNAKGVDAQAALEQPSRPRCRPPSALWARPAS